MEVLMEDLGTLVLSLQRIPLSPKLELLMEDSAGNWCEETNRCIPYGYCLVEMVSDWENDKLGKVGRAGLAWSVRRLSCYMLWGSDMLDHGSRSHLYASMWIKTVWQPRGHQVLHQRWIWGIHCLQATKYTTQPGFDTEGRRYQKPQTGVQGY